MRERIYPPLLSCCHESLLTEVEAGEAHEETLYETTCTLYETDPTTASWVSKGTGIIHVNVDKNSLDDPSLKNSRLSTPPPPLPKMSKWR